MKRSSQLDQKIRDLRSQGLSLRAIATQVDVSAATVLRSLSQQVKQNETEKVSKIESSRFQSLESRVAELEISLAVERKRLKQMLKMLVPAIKF